MKSQSDNKELWLCAGGYVDFITDDRMETYRREYHGQSILLHTRVSAHVRHMKAGNQSTLHYYIFSLGRGHRTPNFLRTFHFDLDNSKTQMAMEERSLLMNILELAMAFAFRSLPDDILQEWWPSDSTFVKRYNVHLNVAHPLQQWASLVTPRISQAARGN